MNDCVIKIQDIDKIMFPSEGLIQSTRGKALYAPNSTHISFELFMRCGPRSQTIQHEKTINELLR